MSKSLKLVAIAFAFALTVSTAAAAFNTNLTVGSTGADVSALQSWLISKGFAIPSISSGAASTGYFGSQTKAAVVAYQASVGLPNTGFVGPLTRGVLNGTSASTPVAVGCPVGYTCTANPGTPVVPVTPAGPVVMDGTDGSVTVSLSSYAGNNTIKKGETKDMVAVKLQATAGPVSVTRFDARFNLRPWLYFSTVTLKDSNGVVIATKNLSSAADATELTVGTDYLVRFDGINAVVTPGTDRTLVVSGSVLPTTDKLSSDVSIIVAVPNSSIRTINGKGYTDSIGLGSGFTAGTTGRTITLSSSGSTGNILVRVSPTTPATRIVNTSTNGETPGIVLGKYDFKSENRSATINTLNVLLKSATSQTWSSVYKRLYITDGTQTVQVDSVAATSTFSNLTFNLPQDTWKTVTITADIADQDDFTSGTMASTSIFAHPGHVVGIDSNFTTATVSSGNTAVSNDITFLQSGASLSNTAATSVVNLISDLPLSATHTFTYTFNNTGTSDLYIAKESNTALATTSTFSVTASSTINSSLTVASPSTQSGDSSTVWIIPSGTSRSFVYTGLMSNGAAGSNHSTAVTRVYFDDDTTGLQEYSISFGLEALSTPSRFIGR